MLPSPFSPKFALNLLPEPNTCLRQLPLELWYMVTNYLLSGCWRAAALWARAGAVVFNGMPSKLKFDEDLLRGWLDKRQALATKAGTKVRSLTLKAKTISPACLLLLDSALPRIHTLAILDVLDPQRFLGSRVKELVFTGVTKPYVRGSYPDEDGDLPPALMHELFPHVETLIVDATVPLVLSLVAASPLNHLHLGFPVAHIPALLSSLSSSTLEHLSVSIPAEDKGDNLHYFASKKEWQADLLALDDALSALRLKGLKSITLIGVTNVYPLKPWLQHILKAVKGMYNTKGEPIEVRELKSKIYVPLLYHPRSGQVPVGPGAAVARVRPNFNPDGF
ncbi:hypothetical protein JCM10449v2_001967 [Rhodotorula kratochvilovae]